MNKTQQNICSNILKHYGISPQLDMLMEESAELIKAVNKYKRAGDEIKQQIAKDGVAYEVADVLIMIHQVLEGIGVEIEDVNKIIDYKLARQIERIGNERNINKKYEP